MLAVNFRSLLLSSRTFFKKISFRLFSRWAEPTDYRFRLRVFFSTQICKLTGRWGFMVTNEERAGGVGAQNWSKRTSTSNIALQTAKNAKVVTIQILSKEHRGHLTRCFSQTWQFKLHTLR